eukprot:GHVH01004840.1.p1 GENE.GHVH01004840.1~~GHVH01004840.1.p1  ORF type:complete len:348 (+),score=51.55 GHVH01004840.1:753-1796(+)
MPILSLPEYEVSSWTALSSVEEAVREHHLSMYPSSWITCLLIEHFSQQCKTPDQLINQVGRSPSELNHCIWILLPCDSEEISTTSIDRINEFKSRLSMGYQIGFISRRWRQLAALILFYPSAKIITATLRTPASVPPPPALVQDPWSLVAGLHSVKRELTHLLADEASFRRGLILHGPPGTGKTLLAKALSLQMGASFITVNGASLISPFVGESEVQLMRTFREAKAQARCIIFFDEMDAFLAKSGLLSDRIIAEFIHQIDNTPAGVVVLGATNRIDLIHPLILQPGRFDTRLYVGYPSSPAERREVSRAHSPAQPADPPCFSGRGLQPRGRRPGREGTDRLDDPRH